MRRSSILIACVAAVASLLVGSLAAAQPIVPTANQCTVEPRPIAFFEQFAGTPAAMASPEAAATPDSAAVQMPEGEPADRATRAGVLDTVRQVAACLNAGNFLAVGALYTDAYFERVAEIEGALPAEELAFLAAEPEPLPADNQAGILAIIDVRVLPDGRVAGLFDLQDPFTEPPGPARFLFVFAEQDGRWLIDEETQLGPIDPAQVGTPPA